MLFQFYDQPIIRGADIVLAGFNGTARQEFFQEAKAKVVAQFERDYIQGFLLAHQGNVTRAAQAAQKDRRAFGRLIHKHRIDVRAFKPGAR